MATQARHTGTPSGQDTLLKILKTQNVVLIGQLQQALGDVSRVTVFRNLKHVPYRRSYNHNGRYYTLHVPDRYDDFGLFSHKGRIHFSIDGSLSATVRRLAHEAVAGYSQKELQELLRVRVQSILVGLVNKDEVDREKVGALYIYLNPDSDIKAGQLEKRHEMIAMQKERDAITDHIVIQVLLALIRFPGAKPADVVRHLYGHSPPITMLQVQAVFDRYDLESLGQKGGSSIC